MKSRKLSKKLVINKTTIADLNTKDMTGVYAGGKIPTKYPTICRTACIATDCASCDITCPVHC